MAAAALSVAACQTTVGPNESMMPGGGQAGTTPRGTTAEVAQRAQQQQQLPGGDRLETARLRTELAFNYFQRGQLGVALEEIKAALVADPNYGTAFNVLGLINMDLGENAKADEAFRKSLSILPSVQVWFVGCCIERILQGQQKALDGFAFALGLAQKPAIVVQGIGIVGQD